MARRRVGPLSDAELTSPTTERLLAYRNAPLALQDAAAKSHLDEVEKASLRVGAAGWPTSQDK
jgi:hypothetical protein